MTPQRSVKVRRMDFDDAFDDLPRHFMDGDLVMSHTVAVLSSLFPDGEDFFVRSVRKLADRIDDPELSKQVKGFIGQEATHGREHRAFNRHLATLGYPTRAIERVTDRVLRVLERIRPAKVNLAVTAALEHYTATLAEVLMENDDARAMFGGTAAGDLLLWHALEESEHKAVAFDAYVDVCDSHLVRVSTMNLVTVGFVFYVIAWTTGSVLTDRSSLNVGRLLKSLGRLRHSPFLTADVLRRIRAYNRRDFHPDDRDASELVAHWRAELFGADGALSERLAA